MFTPEETKILHMIAKAIDSDVVPDEGTPYEPGNRVLSLILKAIKDSDGGGSDGSSDDSGSGVAPLVVEGEMDDNGGAFTPNSGQSTWDEAKEAYVSGRNVVLIAATSDGDEPVTETVISYNPYADTPLLHGGDSLYWLKPGEGDK